MCQNEVQFMENHGVTPAESGHCIMRLLGKHCNGNHSSHNPPGTDHPRLWLKDGKPYLFTIEPYDMDFTELSEMILFCNEHGFTVSAHGCSMHKPGGTVLFIFKVKVSYSATF